jgi:cysteine desulfurase
MSGVSARALQRICRACPRQTLVPKIRDAGFNRIGASARTARRSYVTESKSKSAQVSLESTIAKENEVFLRDTGKRPEDVKLPGSGLSADAAMSPAAGR